MGLPSLFYGAVINPESLISLQALPCSLIYVGLDGIIEWMIPQVSKEELSAVLTERGLSEPDVVVLQDGEFLMPGFIDTHTVESLQILPYCLLRLLYNSMPCNSPPLERQ